MELLGTKCTRFSEISQSSVMLRLKIEDQILFIDKTEKEVKIMDFSILEKYG